MANEVGPPTTDEKMSDRFRRVLVEHSTWGDGKTLCCSVDRVYEMFVDCEMSARADGAFYLLEKLAPLISTDAIRRGLELIGELNEPVRERLRRAGRLAPAKKS